MKETLEQKVQRLENKLKVAEELLSEAHDTLDNVHCYDTDVYRDISKYFNEDEEE